MPNKIAPPPADSFPKLEEAAYLALQMYSNVHRGAGHNSLVSTRLFDQSRDVVLDYLGLPGRDFEVIFANPQRAKVLKNLIGLDVTGRSQAGRSGCRWESARLRSVKKNCQREFPTRPAAARCGWSRRITSSGLVPRTATRLVPPRSSISSSLPGRCSSNKQNPKAFTQKNGDPKKLLSAYEKSGTRGDAG